MSKDNKPFTIDGVTFCGEWEYRRRVASEMRRDPTLTKEGAHAIVVERERESEKAFAVMRAAHADASAKGFGKGNAGSGEIPCTKCGGTLRYSVSSYNGHMHGVCSTPNCLAWME